MRINAEKFNARHDEITHNASIARNRGAARQNGSHCECCICRKDGFLKWTRMLLNEKLTANQDAINDCSGRLTAMDCAINMRI